MATNPPPGMGQPDPYGGQQPQQQQQGGFTQGSVRAGAMQRMTGGRKPFFLTSEFLTLVLTSVILLIAAAVADDFGAAHVWTLFTVLSFGYIVSRGFAKHEHRD